MTKTVDWSIKFPNLKNVDTISSELVGKVLDLYEIDDYMMRAGYESILPAEESNLRKTGLIFYPFDPFLNEIDIFVSVKDKKYFIEKVEHFSDVDIEEN